MCPGGVALAALMERTRPRLGLGRDFDRLWVGESASAVGTQLTALALPTLAILDLRSTPLEVGVLTACTFAGYPLVGFLGAPLVDRIARRSTLLATPTGEQLSPRWISASRKRSTLPGKKVFG